MKCPRCHRENTGKNKTCLYCGTPLRAVQKKAGSRLIAIPVAICSASVVIIIVCSIILLGDKSSKIRDQIALGYRALQEENYEQAEVYFEKALELGGEDPSPEAQVRLAEALQMQDRPQEAIEYLQQARINPTPIPQNVIQDYNYMAEHLALPTITPMPIPSITDYVKPPAQLSPVPVSPTPVPPVTEGDHSGEETEDTTATPGTVSEPGQDPAVTPGGQTGGPIDLEPVVDEGGGADVVGGSGNENVYEDEKAMLLEWFDTNVVPEASVAKAITDLNNDDHPELVVTEVENDLLKAELRTVEDGNVTYKGGINSQQEFGNTIIEKDYQGTQSCFVDESGVHILTNVIGEDDGMGSPQARTTLTTMSLGEGSDITTTELEMIDGNGPEPIAGKLEESETNPNAEWLRNMAGELTAENSNPEGDLSKVQNPIEGGVASVGIDNELLFISAYKAPGEEGLNIVTNGSAGTPEPTEAPEEDTSEGETGGEPGIGTEVISDGESAPEQEGGFEVISDGESGPEQGSDFEVISDGESGPEQGGNPEAIPDGEPGTGTEENVEGSTQGTETAFDTEVITETPEEPNTEVLDPSVETEWETFSAENTADTPEQTPDPTYTDNSTGQQPTEWGVDQDPMQALNPENAVQTPTDETALLTQQAASFPATFTQMTGDAGAANGVIGTKIVEIAGSKKLVVVSINSGALMFDLYAVQNGQVVKTGSGSGQGAFGNATDMYNASQVVFNTSAGIGIASAHVGRADGNMCTVNFWTVDPTGNTVPSVNTSWNSGSDISAFQGQLVPAGLNGNWAVSLEQDGAPNPLSGGIGSAEPGVSDIAVATANGAAGNMTINAMSKQEG